MAISYRGEFGYYTYLEGTDTLKRGPWVAISSFSVVGGWKRTVDLKATTDFSVSSEMVQALQYHNITLFMPPTKGGDDMQVALELSEYATKKTRIWFDFWVGKLVDGNLVESFRLYDFKALMKNPPQIVAEGLLKIELSLSLEEARILHGIMKGGIWELQTSNEE
jgi:hypothetical protein